LIIEIKPVKILLCNTGKVVMFKRILDSVFIT